MECKTSGLEQSWFLTVNLLEGYGKWGVHFVYCGRWFMKSLFELQLLREVEIYGQRIVTAVSTESLVNPTLY